MATDLRQIKRDDAGFAAQWSPAAARRQFNLSVGLLASLAIAAALLTVMLRFEPLSVRTQMAAKDSAVMLEGRSAATGQSTYGKLTIPFR